MDQVEIKKKKVALMDEGITVKGRPQELKCEICGRKIAVGEWVTKNLSTNTIICEDCGEGVTGETFFSIDE
ncbi:MAG TPA: hypothetical protein VKK79_20115 [Candidatus Lokiarchaeia archaeon]|nr:hypothetical protein [Candidatus Lokiarchaeia archaeon]